MASSKLRKWKVSFVNGKEIEFDRPCTSKEIMDDADDVWEFLMKEGFTQHDLNYIIMQKDYSEGGQ
jgi:hypothetical protein